MNVLHKTVCVGRDTRIGDAWPRPETERPYATLPPRGSRPVLNHGARTAVAASLASFVQLLILGDTG